MNANLRFYLLSIFLAFSILGKSQDADFDENTNNTYALIIGISDYADESISDLSFAHRDAEIFSEFLQSPGGGSVPKDNIRLLTNEKATLAAIDDGFNWLLTETNEEDLAVIYFSGHGDVEKQTLWQLGYLLCHNTPNGNYRNQATRLEDLNRLSLMLSAEKNVKTVLVLDACRAGKLAGSGTNGPALTAEQASKRESNEIRILSCKSDQQSWESNHLGGGRGVFSYFLINGLKGEADKPSNDGVVTFMELSQFTKPKVRAVADTLSKRKKRQEPVFVGDDYFELAKIENSGLPRGAAADDYPEDEELDGGSFDNFPNSTTSVGSLSSSSRKKSTVNDLIEEIFEYVDFYDFTENLDFHYLSDDSDKKEVVEYFVIQLLSEENFFMTRTLERELKKLVNLNPKSRKGSDAVSPEFRKKLERRLAVALHDKGQEVINLYLTGDTVELNRRSYYSENKKDYDNYAGMFAASMKLLPKNHFSYSKLEIKYHYFKGIAARLKIPVADNPGILFETAKKEQLKAFELDDKAAYIQNELGILSKLEKKYQASEKYFLEAINLSPSWAIPQSNLAGLYLQVNETDKAEKACEKAKALQPDLATPYYFSGIVEARKNDHLHAEELFRRASELDSKDFAPIRQLAYVFLEDTDYFMADSFFYLANLKRGGIHPNEDSEEPGLPYDFSEFSEIETSESNFREKTDLERLSIAEAYSRDFRFREALSHLEYLENLNRLDFINSLQLADFYIRSGRFDEADKILKKPGIDYTFEEEGLKTALMAKAALNSGKSQEAIYFYEAILKLEEYPVFEQYSIARAYADLGETEKAIRQLKKVLEAGFNFPFVLKYDDKWNRFRKNPKWDEMMKKYLSENAYELYLID